MDIQARSNSAHTLTSSPHLSRSRSRSVKRTSSSSSSSSPPHHLGASRRIALLIGLGPTTPNALPPPPLTVGAIAVGAIAVGAIAPAPPPELVPKGSTRVRGAGVSTNCRGCEYP